jgi:hypothetical protein
VNIDYDLFEVFPDGSVKWRVGIRGTQLALATLAAIGKQTVNECFVKNLSTQQVIGRVNEASAADSRGALQVEGQESKQ